MTDALAVYEEWVASGKPWTGKGHPLDPWADPVTRPAHQAHGAWSVDGKAYWPTKGAAEASQKWASLTAALHLGYALGGILGGR